MASRDEDDEEDCGKECVGRKLTVTQYIKEEPGFEIESITGCYRAKKDEEFKIIIVETNGKKKNELPATSCTVAMEVKCEPCLLKVAGKKDGKPANKEMPFIPK